MNTRIRLIGQIREFVYIVDIPAIVNLSNSLTLMMSNQRKGTIDWNDAIEKINNSSFTH